jgi:hypothetical protein
VTASLVQLLQAAVGTDVAGATVTTTQPNENGTGLPERGVNLFLYQVTPNVAWRNADLPTRTSNSELVRRPTTALDLHYLLTFYGDDPSLEAQRVLGSAVRALHVRPVLTRDVIQDAIAANAFLATPVRSNLADAIELVKFTPISLTLEELSKLWSVFFQIPYTLSVAYQAMVVFIETDDVPRSPLPVRDRTLTVLPLRTPAIEEIEPDRAETGATLTLRGSNLAGDVTRVRFGDELATPSSVTGSEITVDLPATLRAGVLGVQVVHELNIGIPPTPHRGFESNVAPLVLLPSITVAPATVVGGNPLTIQFTPAVERRQRVALLLDHHEISIPPRPDTDPETTNQLDFPTNGLDLGDYLMRLRVDGADSALTIDAVTGEYDGPTVTIT